MSDTPRTNEARLRLDSDDSSCAIYTYTLDGSSYSGEVVRGDKMEELERENAAMREVIKEASSHLSAFLGFYSDSLTISKMRFLSNGLTKLQPFLTDPKQ